MTSMLVPIEVAVPSLAMSEAELLSVLGNSIYPGAKPESMKLVISYCRAARLDPLQKPVHIVPMDVKTGRKDQNDKDIYEKRDVIMPGIGLYRTNAARTSLYAGKSEPEFGPAQEWTYTTSVWEGRGSNRREVDKQETMEYPEWCRVTVEKIVDGKLCRFTAKELWIENYATAGNWTEAPNKMWKKRPFAQLAKCTEAQALRMAFPDAVGAAPTAEEMEGKTIDAEVIRDLPQVQGPQARNETAALAGNPEQPQSNADTGNASGAGAAPAGATAAAAAAGTDGDLLSPGAKQTLDKALAKAGRSEADLVAAGFGKIADLRFPKFQTVMDWVKKNPATAGK